MPTVFLQTDEYNARYFNSTYSMFSPLYVIHILSELTPAPRNWGQSDCMMSNALEASNVLIAIEPISVQRKEPVELNESLKRGLPTRSVSRHAPLPASHILTVLSLDANASQVESCEKATELTQLLWPLSVCRYAPLLVSQILTVLSLDADPIRVESYKKATELTQPLWPLSVCRYAPLLASQILTVLSLDADASQVEPCEKVTKPTHLLWSSSVCRHAL